MLNMIRLDASDIELDQIGVFIGALYNGNQTVVKEDQTSQSADESTFIGGYWIGIKSDVSNSSD